MFYLTLYCPHLHGSVDHWTHANECNTFLCNSGNHITSDAALYPRNKNHQLQWRENLDTRPSTPMKDKWSPTNKILWRQQWQECEICVTWMLDVVTCVYICLSYFVMLVFESLLEEFLQLWILKVILVCCWHKVRKIIVSECVWRL